MNQQTFDLIESLLPRSNPSLPSSKAAAYVLVHGGSRTDAQTIFSVTPSTLSDAIKRRLFIFDVAKKIASSN